MTNGSPENHGIRRRHRHYSPRSALQTGFPVLDDTPDPRLISSHYGSTRTVMAGTGSEILYSQPSLVATGATTASTLGRRAQCPKSSETAG